MFVAMRAPTHLHGAALDAAMVFIGMRFACTPSREPPNIEDTVLAAARVAVDYEDLRVFDVLVLWLLTHANVLNTDRLLPLLPSLSPRCRAFWSAAASFTKMRRLAPATQAYEGPRLDISGITTLHVARHGEDERFVGTPLRVPANLLRLRCEDVDAPMAVASRHPAYRWRTTIGPGYRAGCWAILESSPGLSISELARRAHSSYATAHRAAHDFAVANGHARHPSVKRA